MYIVELLFLQSDPMMFFASSFVCFIFHFWKVVFLVKTLFWVQDFLFHLEFARKTKSVAYSSTLKHFERLAVHCAPPFTKQEKKSTILYSPKQIPSKQYFINLLNEPCKCSKKSNFYIQNNETEVFSIM